MPGTVSMPNSGLPVTIASLSTPGNARADDLVLVLGLELERLGVGHGQCGGLGRQLAIAEPLAACRMDNRAVVGRAFALVNAPLFRCGRDKHCARNRAGLAQLIPVLGTDVEPPAT